jgi:hypothetical protein
VIIRKMNEVNWFDKAADTTTEVKTAEAAE